MLIDLLTRPTARYFRARTTVGLFANHLKGSRTIIDIGAGTCRIARYLSDTFELEVTPLDIVDYNKTALQLTLYDGKRIPFAEGIFDIALLIFVLHHCRDQEMMLKEALRVAKKVIILEDTPTGNIEKRMWRFWDWLLNLGRDISMLYSSRSDENWLCLFKRLGLNLLEKRNFRLAFSFFWSYQQSLYVLEGSTPGQSP